MAEGTNAKADIAIIGGGIVGLATAYNFMQRYPDKSLVVLEKEANLAHHQTGHNSGVLHSGIYYKPGSLKAINCRAGKKAMEAFCEQYGLEYELCGKVIVAVDDEEVPRLEKVFEKGQANGVNCRMISAEEMKEIEPHAAGVKAIHVPETGIVNYRQVCEKMAELMQEAGHRVLTNAGVKRVRRMPDSVVLETASGEVEADLIVNCAGLHCDRVTKLSGDKPQAQIVPFKGEYYELKPEARYLVEGLIYPTPDPQFPFLGVHFTKMIDKDEHGHHVECGPNAVLAFGREAYGKFSLKVGDLAESLTYGGFMRMAIKHWRMGLGEMHRSYSKKAFVKALQRLLPEIQGEHLEHAPAGIRAQAVTPEGGLVDDFLIVEADRAVHINNAPSPAATASMNIGKLVVDKLEPRLGTPTGQPGDTATAAS